jgi:CHASE1-domain containing sensor protein
MSVTADTRSAALGRSALVVLLTTAAYGVVGWISLQLALTSGIASPIFPAAGIALASTVVFGFPGAIGAALGAFIVNGLHASVTDAVGPVALMVVPAGIAMGAALQALLGTALAQRAVGHPVVLREPRQILRFAGYAGLLGCLLNASWSTAVLAAAGAITSEEIGSTWWTWWTGDTLGVLIGAPIALTLIGRPRDEWAPRRTSVGLPMLMGTLLLAVASMAFHRQEQARTRAAFEDSANNAAETVAGHLEESMHALQAVHGAFANQPEGRRPTLRPVADWWLRHATGVRAIGYSERVPRADVAAFEARARAEGLSDYRVFDRPDSGGITAADPELVAIRSIEPATGNLAALGVNALSIPAAREAMLAAAATGSEISTRGFRLTQAERPDSVGVVVYRALYQGAAASEAARRAQWRGVVFVTLELDRVAQAAMTRLQTPLHWCLVEPAIAPDVPRRLAGPAGCERPAKADLTLSRPIAFAGQTWEMRLWAHTKDVPGGSHAGTWLFSLVGLVATAMLGLLLLTVTGRARRIELAVEERTQALSDEIGERRVAEDALRDSEQRLRSILDHVPIGVVFMDAQGRILDSNPSMCRMLHRTADELTRLTVRDLTHPDEHAPTWRRRAS